jgi:tetratricopeptide (TPR) repeat protein
MGGARLEADKGKILQNANQLAAKGQFDKAVAEWKKLLADAPKDGSIHNNIGDLHLKRSAINEAVDSYFQAGSAFQAAGSALKAIAVYKKVLKLDPTRYSVYQLLADLNAERGLVNNAISDYLTLSKLYLKDARIRDALGVYRKIVDLDPTNLVARQRLAELCLQENLRDDAIKAYFHLGKECVAQQEYEQAKKAYQAILKLDPGNARADRLLKDPKAALQEVRPDPVAAIVPVTGNALEQAQQHIAIGQYDQADSMLSDLLSAQPGDPEVCRLLAMLHLKRGELAVALSEIQFLSEAAMRAEDYTLAESMIREYLKADAGCVPLLELLGLVYEQNGNRSAAATSYGQAAGALLKSPDPDAPDRPGELFAKMKALDPSNPLII